MRTTTAERALTCAELDTLLECDNRVNQRVAHQTRVQVIVPREDGSGIRPDIGLGWTEDVSAGGAKLVVWNSVLPDRFWIRIAETARRDEFIECLVKWSEDGPQQSSESFRRHGVQFQRSLSREEFDKVLAAQ